MRDINSEELPQIQGGIVIEATAIVGLVVASIYLINSLVDAYIASKGGSTPTEPSTSEISQITTDIESILPLIPKL
jgi:hypothetical protein